MPAMPSRVFRAALLWTAFALLAPAQSAFSQVVDQSNGVGVPGSLHSLLTGYGEGQTFRPTLDRIDYAQFAIGRLGFGNGDPGTLFATIHHGARTNPALAQSPPVPVSGTNMLFPIFLFDPPVPLVPGDSYSLVLHIASGTENWGIGTTQDTYARGQLIATYGDAQLYDAWFREGTMAPVPSATLTWGRVKAAYR